jgi:hypothetical protein
MAAKKPKSKRLEGIPAVENGGARVIQWVSPGMPKETASLRSSTMSSKHGTRGNRYLCALERTQNGKYNVRVRAFFASSERAGARDGDGASASAEKAGWSLPVYFLASSFNASMKKLEESLQTLQKNEERLRFWGLERSDDPNVAGELLQELGLWLDRRRDFPRKTAEIAAASERPITASSLATVRRVLADSMAQERPAGRPALASD